MEHLFYGSYFIPMKKFILPVTFLFLIILSTQAQVFKDNEGTSLKDLVNTLGSRIKLSGYAQFGYTYDPAEKVDNTFDIKRIIFMADGKITDRWKMYFMYDFKSSKTLEIYTEYKFFDALKVRLGQYKTPLTLENQLSPSAVELIDCYSLAASYMAGISPSDDLYGSQGGRDQGLMIYGDFLPAEEGYHRLGYKLAVMNGQGINIKDRNTQKDIIGSLSYKPCSEATLCATMEEGRGNAVATSVYNPDLKVGDNYRRARWSVGGEVKTSLADLRSEYMAGRDAAVRSEGFYATGNLHLTRVIDLVVSYDYLNRNKSWGDRAEQTNYVAGLLYWFYPRCRLQLIYTYRDMHEDIYKKGGNLLQAQVQFRF